MQFKMAYVKSEVGISKINKIQINPRAYKKKKLVEVFTS